VLDKGSGAVMIIGVDTYDMKGNPIFYNQYCLFVVGSGNFGGKRSSTNSEVKSPTSPPNRSPDAVITQQTSINQVSDKIPEANK